MTIIPERLPWEELVPLKLRALYESFGYKKYHMGKFEPYDLYRENKNFLKSESIITFTNANGKLMALRPDVTMSIVKNVKPDVASEKVYYMENVFRMDSAGIDFREINQIGLEYIGCESGSYAEAEAVALAIKSLEAISPDYILGVSHMGFVAAVLEECGFSGESMEGALRALKQKNLHELGALCKRAGIAPERTERLCAVAGISGPMEAFLKKLRGLPLSDAMQTAIDELSSLIETLAAMGCEKRVHLDFSVINDLDYYNGLVFQGYIQKVPSAVLAGGRYDNLMRRFGKAQPALGFALYLGELTRAFHTVSEYDADALLIYGDAPPVVTARVVGLLMNDGMSVRAEREMPAGLRGRRTYLLSGDGAMEVTCND